MPEKDSPRLSIVLPVYNEEKRLDEAFEDILGYLKGRGEPWELVVVDDGSRDRTAELVAERMKEEPRIRLVRLESNQGKGEAVRRGMLEARGELRLFRDADNATRMRELERFRPHLEEGVPVVIGSRRVEGARFIRRQPWLRESLGKGFTLLSRLLFVWRVRDYTCGFKCFSAEAAEAVFSRQRTKRWAFDSEILFLADRLGYRIVQVPVRWEDDAGTHVHMFLDVVRSLSEILQVRLTHLFGLYRLGGK